MHSEDSTKRCGKVSIEYFGIKMQCLSTTAAELLRAILLQDVKEVKNWIDVQGANVNDLYRCSAKDRDPPRVSYTLTPLSLAVRFSTNHVVRSLLGRGANPNVKCDMTPLGVAIQRNNKKLAALLLDSGADINLQTHPVMKWKSSDVEGIREHLMQTPLHIACRKGLVAMTAYLLLKQAATDIIDGSGTTPASVARKYGHSEVEKLILRSDACRASMSVRYAPCPDEPVRITTRCERTKTTQLIMACAHNDLKKASCLIAYGTDVNATDASSNTALHCACTNGNQKLVKLLLKNDAKTYYALNKDKKGALQLAMEYGYLEVVFILIEHKCVIPDELLFAVNSNGNTLLHIACKQNRISAVKQLIKRGAFLNVANRKGKSPIHYAWQSGIMELRRMGYIFQYHQTETLEGWQRFDVVIVKRFKRHVELASYRMLSKVVSQEGRGSLEEVHSKLCSACGKLTPVACYFLLSRGMYNSRILGSCCSRPCTANCTSLLHIVCCKRSTEDWEMVRQLIEHGADVNAVDCCGNTPLHLACSCGYGHRSIIATLLDNGASPYIVNNDDKTPLFCAFSKNDSELVRWLISQKEIDVDADVLHGFNDKENTLLLMLATEVNDELLWRLVERSARINVPPQTTIDRRHNMSVNYREQPRLLEALARNDKWSLIRKLVEVGCCDFTTDIFRLLLPFARWPRLYTRSLCSRHSGSRIQMLKWFLLAGFGQRDELRAHTDAFLQEFCLREFNSEWKSEYDSEMTANGEDASYNEHPFWAKTKTTLTLLHHEMENPPSMSRLCVYTIRRQLIYADPDGKSIFPSIDQLPLPTRVKDSLKLRDIEYDAECFNQQQSRCLFDLLLFFRGRPIRPPHFDVSRVLQSFMPTPHYSRRSWLRSYLFAGSRAEESTFDVEEEEQPVGRASHSIGLQLRPRKPNSAVKKFVRKPTVSHTVRRSRTLVQPKRRH